MIFDYFSFFCIYYLCFILLFKCVVLHCCISFRFFFFFKQKTAYDLRISDWIADVCPSDLRPSISVRRSAPCARPCPCSPHCAVRSPCCLSSSRALRHRPTWPCPGSRRASPI